ncbi:hypothetical protein [[Eubacterium] hominis]|uniref:hypothetical protein n=1 Tax=[Eubacterium] hominis TaxID=2764325 RepID=UPI00205E34A0|nr:MAG TPA: hypothetical protein [Caudoviricetes sp.]
MKKLICVLGCLLAVSLVGNLYLWQKDYFNADYEIGYGDGYERAIYEIKIGALEVLE